MKKIFFLATAAFVAASVNAETVFDWANQKGVLQITGSTEISSVKIEKNTTDVTCIKFNNGYAIDTTTTPATHLNYVEIAPAEGGFLAGDIVKVEFCYNNSSAKVAVVGIYNLEGKEIAASGEGINARLENGVTPFNYVITEDVATIRIARAKSGKTATCITKLEVVRGEEIAVKTLNPQFSVPGGEYFEAFELSLATNEEGATIFFRLNETGDYAEYATPIKIENFDMPTVVEAFATKAEAENSDTVKAEYKLTHFTPRTVFNARTIITFADIKAEDIILLDPGMAEVGSTTMDNASVPSVSYKTAKNFDGTQDSTMDVSFVGKENVHFVYKNKDNKSNIIKCAKNYLQLDGSNFEMHLSDLLPGDTIVFVVTAKGTTSPVFSNTYSASANMNAYEPENEEDPDYTDGEIYTKSDARVDDDYSGYTNLVYIVKEGKRTAKLKETKGGFRLAEILIGAYRGEEPDWNKEEAVENVNASVKAVKRIVNGQIIIEKGDRKFNVLGTEMK